MINNLNFLWFDQVESLQLFNFQTHINKYKGADLSTGFEYRPFLNNNVIVRAGVSSLVPGAGFKDLYNRLNDSVNALWAGFLQMQLTY
jgi:hypothetical protein